MLRESGLCRDVVYGDHKDLVEEFQARVQAQHRTPAAAQSLAEENSRLKQQPADATAALTREREAAAALRRLVAELGLELHTAREETGPSRVTALPPRRRPGGRRS